MRESVTYVKSFLIDRSLAQPEIEQNWFGEHMTTKMFFVKLEFMTCMYGVRNQTPVHLWGCNIAKILDQKFNIYIVEQISKILTGIGIGL